MISPSGKTRYLAPTRPNAGLEAEYRRKLTDLIAEMHRSLMYWIGAAYKQNKPEIAKLAADAGFFGEDASPARSLIAVLGNLVKRWQSRFDDLAPELARWFATSAQQRSDVSLRASLRKAGISVWFKTTRAVNDAVQASIGENVGLIRSIASQHLTQVEGMVLRSVQRGGDLATLTAELEAQYGVTKRRSALIARDQNHKATSVVARVRAQELGITEAVWMHSAGGREPRPTHVRAGLEKQRYRVAEGWYDSAERRNVWPGELINCRCVSRPVLPAVR
jgi:uncharacterized protein with gpF-like domain